MSNDSHMGLGILTLSILDVFTSSFDYRLVCGAKNSLMFGFFWPTEIDPSISKLTPCRTRLQCKGLAGLKEWTSDP